MKHGPKRKVVHVIWIEIGGLKWTHLKMETSFCKINCKLIILYIDPGFSISPRKLNLSSEESLVFSSTPSAHSSFTSTSSQRQITPTNYSNLSGPINFTNQSMMYSSYSSPPTSFDRVCFIHCCDLLWSIWDAFKLIESLNAFIDKLKVYLRIISYRYLQISLKVIKKLWDLMNYRFFSPNFILYTEFEFATFSFDSCFNLGHINRKCNCRLLSDKTK